MANVGYCSVKPIINVSNNVLRALDTIKYPAGAQRIGWDKLHCTLMYDERNPDLPKLDIPPEIYPAEVVGVAVLGKAVVLLLSSRSLQERVQVIENHGFKSSFDNYTPHMSVIYSEDEKTLIGIRDRVQKLVDDCLLPKILYFTDETWNPCK